MVFNYGYVGLLICLIVIAPIAWVIDRWKKKRDEDNP
jgi:hypothetical protein